MFGNKSYKQDFFLYSLLKNKLLLFLAQLHVSKLTGFGNIYFGYPTKNDHPSVHSTNHLYLSIFIQGHRGLLVSHTHSTGKHSAW